MPVFAVRLTLANGTTNLPDRPKRKACSTLLPKFGREAARMDDTAKTSHLMLFCALLLVRKSRTSIKDIEQLYPFDTEVEIALQELAKLES